MLVVTPGDDFIQLFSSLTVRQNIQFPLRENLVLSDALRDEIAAAKLEMVGFKPEDGDKFPSELSGGTTKRVALVRPPRSGSTEAIFSSSLRATDFTQECQHPLPGG